MHVRGTARTDARVMREAVALAQAGYDVTIVDVERDRSRGRAEVIEGVRLKHLIAPSQFKSARFKPWFLVRFASIVLGSLLLLLRTPADLYHAHDWDGLLPTYYVARLRRKPLILDAHELPLVQPVYTRWRLLHRLATHQLRKMLKRCTATITVSPPLVGEMRRRFGGPPAVVVRNTPTYQPPIASNRLREALGLPPTTRLALYQGNIQANRTLDVLVRAARYLDPGIIVVLMGNGPLVGAMERLIAEEGVGERVKMLPAVPYAELLSWTASADLGLLVVQPDFSPSVKMSLPNKLFEYLMAGLPVLTSEMDAIVETVLGYRAGDVIRTLEPELVAKKISAMLADRSACA
jgi:glycosyltransferase involved in cell wall biosynthesis